MSGELVKFLSSHFNANKTLPRMVRLMRYFAIVGIAIAVTALIVAVSIGKGFQREYRESLLNFNAHLVILGIGEIDDYEDVMQKIAGLGNSPQFQLKGVTPFIYREAMIVGKGGIRGVVVKGVDAKTISSVNHMNIDTDIKDAFKKTDSGKLPVIMGASLEEEYKDGALRLIVPDEKKEKYLDIKIAGRFNSGIYDYDSQFVLFSLDDVRSMFGIRADRVSGFELRIDDPMLAGEAASFLESRLGPFCQITTWEELNHDLMSAVRLERLMSATIMGIMVLVAIMNVIVVLVLILIHRFTELAIFKTLGLTDKLIQSVMVHGGVKVVTIGTSIGLVLGISISEVVGRFNLIPLQEEIYLIKSLPIEISIPICVAVAAFCIISGYLASKLTSGKLLRAPVIRGLSIAR